MFAIILGAFMFLIGYASLQSKAFQDGLFWRTVIYESLGWKIVYGLLHLRDNMFGLFSLLVGLVLLFTGIYTIPYLRAEAVKEYDLPESPNQLPARVSSNLSARLRIHLPAVRKGPDLNAQIQEDRQRLETLQAAFYEDGQEVAGEYRALEAERKALNSTDTAAIVRFNEKAASYGARNTARRQTQAQITAVQAELDALLDARLRQIAANSARIGKIVIYTAPDCPEAEAATRYFDRKGLPYEEIDVDSSPAGSEEFRKLGGHVLPLILVGKKRMEGFNVPALDAILQE
jgi:glutaredoxin